MHTDTKREDVGEKCLIDFCQLFEFQVSRTPNHIAVFFEDDVFTYEQLNSAANQIAHHLLSFDPAREQPVGICLDRSFYAIAAMIGIFKAGCAFVPLDPEFPADRLEFIVADAQIERIICDSRYRSLFDTNSDCTLIHIETIHSSDTVSSNPNVEIASDGLAYIMYTSGSTGQPKGVQIEHKSLATYCFADIDLYEVVESDRTLQFSTLNFDIAIEEIFPPLLTGGSVVVRPSERAADHNELTSIVERYDVTAIHLATAFWHEWVDLMLATGSTVPSSIRLMVVTGEKVSTEHYRRWKTICNHDVLWCNAYGPTEATVTATVFIPDQHWDEDNMPIGKPLKRYDALIFDESNQPVAIGETGELLIGGPAIARGYLNRDDLNEKAFVTLPNNVADEDRETASSRYYRTGDLARCLPNGDIEFAGRIDHQIKLGSYRIEPGEIEAAVNQYPHVRESLISYEEIKAKKYLIAYVARGSDSIDLSDLASFLRDRLPVYMVPTRFVLIESFLKTINGKVDRKKLPAASESQVARNREYTAPTTPMEKQLATIWADVLNLQHVGIDDDFFSLGGSSLLVTRVITQIRSRMDVEIPVRDFFANPTIRSIARHIAMLVTPNQVQLDSVQISRSLRDKLPIVNPSYFNSGHFELFGIHYKPVGNDVHHAVLICPAYGHEYARAHRNLQQLACQLAQNGYHVLRFDYSATGNSSGACEDACVEAWQQDCLAAAKQLLTQSQATKLSVIGIRLGATLAAEVGSAFGKLQKLILWDPIFDGNEYCELLSRFHDETLVEFNRFQGHRKRSEIDQAYGYVMTKTKRDGFSSLRLNNVESCSDRTFLVTSKEFLEQQSTFSLPSEWRVHQTDDELYWQLSEYTESAFASPDAYRNILEILRDNES